MNTENNFLESDPNNHILIVDDNPQNLQVLGRCLQEQNYEIEFATNGKSALEWLELQSFDLILLDINMPEMDGFEVCRKLRSNAVFNRVPVIFLSADSDRESVLKGFELGAQDYVTKPFDSRELLVRVKTHLALKSSLEKVEKINSSLEEKVAERTLNLQSANEQLKLLNSELIIAKERAEESDRLKTAFMNTISHEIRTPLNGILGFGSFIVEPDISQQEKEEYLNIINNCSDRLVNTVTDYMDISLIVSGNIKVNLHDLDYFSLMQTLHNRFHKQCTKKYLELKLQHSKNTQGYNIISDRALLEKAFTHILNNAVKFTSNGKITMGYEFINDRLEFFIKDTGIGITQDAQNRVFEAFMQENVSNTRVYEGNGLGLSIATGLIKLLNGNIRIESEKNQGTTVYITLPIEQNTVNKETAFTTSEKIIKRLSFILIAEDDDQNYLFLEIFLKKYADKLVRAVNSQEAIQMCIDNPDIDLVLMDIKMPLMDGYEAIRQIRQFNKDVIIIAQTSYGLTGDKEKSIEAGSNEHISKPIAREELLVLVQKYFTKHIDNLIIS